MLLDIQEINVYYNMDNWWNYNLLLKMTKNMTLILEGPSSDGDSDIEIDASTYANKNNNRRRDKSDSDSEEDEEETSEQLLLSLEDVKVRVVYKNCFR